MPESTRAPLAKIIGLARTLYASFVYLLIGSGVIIAALLVLAPRPEYGFPPSHPLTIATWSVLSTAVVTVLLYVAYSVVEAVASSMVSFINWINGETTEEPA